MSVNPFLQLAKRYRNTLAGGGFVLTLHDTDIVKAWSDIVVLYSGGWRTLTTKKRINEGLEALGLTARVIQSKGEWTVNGRGWYEGIPLTL